MRHNYGDLLEGTCRRYYLLHHFANETVHPLAKAVFRGFFCKPQDLAEEIHRLGIDDNRWPSLDVNPPSDHALSYLSSCVNRRHYALALQFTKGRWQLYQLPQVLRHQIAYQKGKAYTLFAGPCVLPHLDKPLTFTHREDAWVWVNALRAEDDYYWTQQLHQQHSSFSPRDPQQLADALCRQALLAYPIPYYDTSTGAAPQPESPAQRVTPSLSGTPAIIPLAAPKNTLEMRYLYADGWGVSGAAYCVKDADTGNELVSGNLNTFGVAYHTLPNHVNQVTIEYHSDPLRDNPVIKPTKPTARHQHNIIWFAHIVEAMQKSWDNTQAGLDWGWGMLQGDFNENPTVGQIITNAVITMIPVVDQVGDVRDIIANLKLLIWDKRYNEFVPWLVFFFTLIGLIPMLGSALKGVLKLIWKGAKLDEVLKVFNWFMKGNGVQWLKALQDGQLMHYATEAADIGHKVFDAITGKLNKLKSHIPHVMTKTHQELNEILATLNTVKGKINGIFEQIAEQLNEKISKLLTQVEPKIDTSPTKTQHVRQQIKEPPPAGDVVDLSDRTRLAEVVPNRGVGDIYDPDSTALSTRDRILANIAESKAARESSSFNTPRTGLPSREWPPFPGSINQVEADFTLLPGTLIDRFGPPRGAFLSPEGTPYTARALKPGTARDDYYVYEVLEPLTVKAGEIKPWFGEVGNGLQYRLDPIDGVRRNPQTLTSGDNPTFKEVYRGKYWEYNKQ